MTISRKKIKVTVSVRFCPAYDCRRSGHSNPRSLEISLLSPPDLPSNIRPREVKEWRRQHSPTSSKIEPALGDTPALFLSGERDQADLRTPRKDWHCDTSPAAPVVTSLSSFLTATRQLDTPGLAARQLSVLNDFAARTAGLAGFAEFHRNYAGWARGMDYLAKREQHSA